MQRTTLIAASALVVSGCYHASLSGDAGSEFGGDGSDLAGDSDVIDLYRPDCGNGVLDDGEECDDGNRLDGDGCDWLCRGGNGEDPPEPDPAVPPYVPAGGPVEIEVTSLRTAERLPLAWTGTAFATVYWDEGDGVETPRYRFVKLDTGGRVIDASWSYEVTTPGVGADLVWSGSSFGFVYGDSDEGLYYMNLDENGKPNLGPVLFEPDPAARFPAMDLRSDGFVVAWMVENHPGIISSICSSDGYIDQAKARVVGIDGTTDGLPGPLTVDEVANGPPDVAAGPDGIGFSLWSDRDMDGGCAPRFVKTDRGLSSRRLSGYLAESSGGGEVIWGPDRYFVSWTNREGCSTEGCEVYEVCVARFTPEGDLERPPVCTPSGQISGPARLAYGDGGLGIVFAGGTGDGTLAFLRTDLSGAAVAPPVDVTTEHSVSFGFTWADDGFALLYTLLVPSTMHMQWFVAE